jgi:hypothetical protein
MKSLLGEYRVKSRLLIYKIKLFVASQDLADKRFEPKLFADILLESTGFRSLQTHNYKKFHWRNVRVNLDRDKLILASGKEVLADNLPEVLTWIKETLNKL